MMFEQARDRVDGRMEALMPVEGEEIATVEAAQVPAVFAGLDVAAPTVTRWLQERAAAACDASGVPLDDGAIVSGEMLRAFLVGLELGRSR